MTAFVMLAVFFILFGFVLGFFFTSRAANKNQGQMKHCQNCHFFKSYESYTPDCDDDLSDLTGMSAEQYKAFLQRHMGEV